MKTQFNNSNDVKRAHDNPDMVAGNEIENVIEQEYKKSTGHKKKLIGFFKKDFMKQMRLQLREAKQQHAQKDSTDVMNETMTNAEPDVSITNGRISAVEESEVVVWVKNEHQRKTPNGIQSTITSRYT